MAGRPPLRIGAHGKITRIDQGGGVWLARCRFRDLDGIVRIVERRTPGDVANDQYGAAAEAVLLDALEARRVAGAGTITSSMLLPALCKVHLDRLEEDGRSARTLDTYRYNVAKLGTWIAGIRVGECTPGRVDAVLRSMGAAHGTVMARQSKTILTGALGLAVLDGALPTNPVKDVSTIKAKTPPKGAPSLTAEELRGLIAAVHADPECVRLDVADPITMFVATGLRRSELFGLLWSEVDEKTATVSVTGKVVRVKGRGLVRFDETKTDAGARTIPLPQFAMAMLRRRVEEPHPSNDGVIFPSSRGTLRDPDNFNGQWRAARDRLGVSDVTSHSFRKSLATLIDDDGMSARVGADHLGHRHVSMTQDRYFGRKRVHTAVADLLDRTVTNDE
ncbi:MAG: site-specific integrase [Corynebacteriales bacterium]|nr:site-specific integrase [Mycobacteriales bacterium]